MLRPNDALRMAPLCERQVQRYPQKANSLSKLILCFFFGKLIFVVQESSHAISVENDEADSPTIMWTCHLSTQDSNYLALAGEHHVDANRIYKNSRDPRRLFMS